MYGVLILVLFFNLHLHKLLILNLKVQNIIKLEFISNHLKY